MFATFPARRIKFDFDIRERLLSVAGLVILRFSLTSCHRVIQKREPISSAAAKPVGELKCGTSGRTGSDFLVFDTSSCCRGPISSTICLLMPWLRWIRLWFTVLEIGVGSSPSFCTGQDGQLKSRCHDNEPGLDPAGCPSLSETFPDSGSGFWIAIFAPKGHRPMSSGSWAIAKSSLVQPEVPKGCLNMVAKPSERTISILQSFWSFG